jgi:hypothetical protein
MNIHCLRYRGLCVSLLMCSLLVACGGGTDSSVASTAGVSNQQAPQMSWAP